MKRILSKKQKNTSLSNKKHSKIIYLIRHGKTIDYSKRYLGQKNPPLNLIGRWQAEYWQKYFSSIKLDVIYSSDLSRAIETAQIISKGQNTPIQYIPKIREINLGKWDGIRFETIRKNYPYSFYMRGVNLEHYRPPGGESFYDLKARVNIAFNEIIEKTKNRSLMVAHAGVNRIIIATILRIPIKKILQIKQDYGSMNKLSIQQNSVNITTMNSTPNLSKTVQ